MERTIDNSLGLFIKWLRESKGIQSTKLSLELEKSRTYISQFEKGKIKKIDYKTARSILEKLGVDENEIDACLKKYNILSNKVLFNIENIVLGISKNIDCDKIIKSKITESRDAWLNDYQKEAKEINDELHDVFEKMIENDACRMMTLLEQISIMTETRDLFELFYSINTHAYDKAPKEDLINVESSVNAIMRDTDIKGS